MRGALPPTYNIVTMTILKFSIPSHEIHASKNQFTTKLFLTRSRFRGIDLGSFKVKKFRLSLLTSLPVYFCTDLPLCLHPSPDYRKTDRQDDRQTDKLDNLKTETKTYRQARQQMTD
jgi:hypothetical protein